MYEVELRVQYKIGRSDRAKKIKGMGEGRSPGQRAKVSCSTRMWGDLLSSCKESGLKLQQKTEHEAAGHYIS